MFSLMVSQCVQANNNNSSTSSSSTVMFILLAALRSLLTCYILSVCLSVHRCVCPLPVPFTGCIDTPLCRGAIYYLRQRPALQFQLARSISLCTNWQGAPLSSSPLQADTLVIAEKKKKIMSLIITFTNICNICR